MQTASLAYSDQFSFQLCSYRPIFVFEIVCIRFDAHVKALDTSGALTHQNYTWFIAQHVVARQRGQDVAINNINNKIVITIA